MAQLQIVYLPVPGKPGVLATTLFRREKRRKLWPP